MWRIMKAKLQCRLHWIRENMTVLDTWRLCKVLNIIFLVILGPTVSTNTYLPYKGSALPPLFTATPLPTPISYGQTPAPFYFRGMPVAPHSKNLARLYPKLQSQPIGLPKIFIDYLFFQADQSDCTKSVSILNRFASSERHWSSLPNLSR